MIARYFWVGTMGLVLGVIVVLAFCGQTNANGAELAACLALVPIGTALLTIHLTLTAMPEVDDSDAPSADAQDLQK